MPDTIRDQKIKTAVRATDARTAGKTKIHWPAKRATIDTAPAARLRTIL